MEYVSAKETSLVKQVLLKYNKTGVADAANNKTVPNRLFAFPIPQSEIDSEYSNVPQNDGY